MTLFKPNGQTIVIEVTNQQISKTLMNELPMIKKTGCTKNGEIYIELKNRRADCKASDKEFENIFEMFPELYLEHAVDGLSGYEFMLARRP